GLRNELNCPKHRKVTAVGFVFGRPTAGEKVRLSGATWRRFGMRELESARSGSLFATLVLSHVWPDGSELNSQLRQSILEHACRSPGKTRTNVGGWHSEPGMLEFCGGA